MPSAICLTGYVRFGDNGVGGAFPLSEYGILDSSGNAVVGGQKVWDSTGAVGPLNSGTVPLLFSVNGGGGTSAVVWTVTGGVTVPLSTSAITYGMIQKVSLTATVAAGGMRVGLTNVYVNFYANGVRKARNGVATFSADTLGQVGAGEEVTRSSLTSRTDIDQVVVEADVSLQTDSDITPGPDDLMAMIKIYTSSCNP